VLRIRVCEEAQKHFSPAEKTVQSQQTKKIYFAEFEQVFAIQTSLKTLLCVDGF